MQLQRELYPCHNALKKKELCVRGIKRRGWTLRVVRLEEYEKKRTSRCLLNLSIFCVLSIFVLRLTLGRPKVASLITLDAVSQKWEIEGMVAHTHRKKEEASKREYMCRRESKTSEWSEGRKKGAVIEPSLSSTVTENCIYKKKKEWRVESTEG